MVMAQHVRTPKVQAQPIFSHIEQRVLDIAWRDSRSMPVLGRPMFRRLRRFFGIPEQLPLADKKLEALRSYALRALRSAGLISSEDDAALIASGFSFEQVSTLRVALNMRHAVSAPVRVSGWVMQ
jgi:hypothetical protein